LPWTDWDYDMLDARSTPSSYVTVLRYEEEIAKQTRVQIEPSRKSKTVMVIQRGGNLEKKTPENGIVVSKQAVVESSARSSTVVDMSYDEHKQGNK